MIISFWFLASLPRFLVIKENKHQTQQNVIKTINNSMQMSFKSKQNFFLSVEHSRVWVEAKKEYKQETKT